MWINISVTGIFHNCNVPRTARNLELLHPALCIFVGCCRRCSEGLDGRVSKPGGGEIFRIHPDRPWGPTSLLHNGQRALSGAKGSGLSVDHLPQPAMSLKKGRAILLFNPSHVDSWHVVAGLFCSINYYCYYYYCVIHSEQFKGLCSKK